MVVKFTNPAERTHRGENVFSCRIKSAAGHGGYRKEPKPSKCPALSAKSTPLFLLLQTFTITV